MQLGDTAECNSALRVAATFNLVVVTNKAAVNLWLSLGFEIIGTMPGVFHHATLGYVDAHVMFLALEGNS